MTSYVYVLLYYGIDQARQNKPRPSRAKAAAEGANDTFKHRKARHERADPIVQVLRALHRRDRLKTSGLVPGLSKYTHFNKLILPRQLNAGFASLLSSYTEFQKRQVAI